MFLQDYKSSGGNEPDANNWEKQLINLDKLTPGDFAVAARQFNIMEMPVTAEGLYRQMMEECRMKGGATRKIGFMG